MLIWLRQPRPTNRKILLDARYVDKINNERAERERQSKKDREIMSTKINFS